MSNVYHQGSCLADFNLSLHYLTNHSVLVLSVHTLAKLKCDEKDYDVCANVLMMQYECLSEEKRLSVGWRQHLTLIFSIQYSIFDI